MPWTNNQSDMANYMFLMQTGNITMDERNLFVLTKLTLTGCGLSIVGALLSVFLVCYVPMRSDALFSIGNLCTCLMAAQLAFAGAENAFPQPFMCKISAAVLHYFFLALHTWFLSYSVHLVMKLFRLLTGQRYRRRCILVVVGWILPIVVVALTGIIHINAYSGEGALCWLNANNGARWAFVGPVVFISVFNMAVLIVMLCMRFLLDTKRDVAIDMKAKHFVTTIVSFLPVSSIPWLTGLAPTTSVGWQYVFVIINSSQGLFILLMHMFLSTQIRSLLRRRINGEVVADPGKPGDQMEMARSTGDADTESSVVNIAAFNSAARRA